MEFINKRRFLRKSYMFFSHKNLLADQSKIFGPRTGLRETLVSS